VTPREGTSRRGRRQGETRGRTPHRARLGSCARRPPRARRLCDARRRCRRCTAARPRAAELSSLPETLRRALLDWASQHQLSLDHTRVWHTRSENPPGEGFFARALGRRSNPVDPQRVSRRGGGAPPDAAHRREPRRQELRDGDGRRARADLGDPGERARGHVRRGGARRRRDLHQGLRGAPRAGRAPGSLGWAGPRPTRASRPSRRPCARSRRGSGRDNRRRLRGGAPAVTPALRTDTFPPRT
jgi:hypothetical protein